MIILSLTLLLYGQPITLTDDKHPFFSMAACVERMAEFKAVLITDDSVNWKLACTPVDWRDA